MAKTILTKEQVADAIYVDYDYSQEELERYANSASSFIKQSTGYDFAVDKEIEPLSIACAKLYIKQLHFGSKEYDYNESIKVHLIHLQDIAKSKLAGES